MIQLVSVINTLILIHIFSLLIILETGTSLQLIILETSTS